MRNYTSIGVAILLFRAFAKIAKLEHIIVNIIAIHLNYINILIFNMDSNL